MKHKKDAVDNASDFLSKFHAVGIVGETAYAAAIVAISEMLNIGILPGYQSLWQRTLNYLKSLEEAQTINLADEILDGESFDPLDNIKQSTDLGFLKQLRDEFIPMDIENVEKTYPFDLEIKMIHKGKISADELKKKKLEGIQQIKEAVDARINEIS